MGFKDAGHIIVWANDNWSDAVKTYRLNLGDHITLGDIREVSLVDVPDADIVIGGFPCQGFSVANMKRSSTDERNLLYLQFRRFIHGKQPLFFVAENVKGIASLEHGHVFEQIKRDFSSGGYRIYTKVLNAADYGVPQRRERMFIVGVRDDLSVEWSFPRPTHAPSEMASLTSLQKWVSIGSAVKDLPDPESLHEIANHDCTKYKLRFNGYLGHRKVNPALPSPTITARGDDRGGVVIHHHPNNKRRLSAREVALIQSFPLAYRFFGTKTSIYRQVANAVPPLLAQHIARSSAFQLDPRSKAETIVNP